MHFGCFLVISELISSSIATIIATNFSQLARQERVMAKILVVEDDVDLAANVSDWLTFEQHLVEVASDGAVALEFLRSFSFDLIIVDWQLPHFSGLELCQMFRKNGGSTPVLFLTGKSEIAEKEAAFDAGADDYLTKPFHPRELVVRVHALIRRTGQTILESKLQVGSLQLHTSSHAVKYKDVPISLTPREFRMLEYFMRHPNNVFTPESLLRSIWPADSEASIESVRVCIKRLRNKLGEDCPIQNLHGHGYQLVVDP